ncbi:MAG: hypothetical protein V1698_02120 [bacterium]
MSEFQKIEKHIGEQRPLNRPSKPVPNTGKPKTPPSSQNNPIKPQETQKGVDL